MREKIDWFELWKADKECMIDTMVRNMVADLDAGYDYFGATIARERAEIEAYKAKYEADLDHIADMEPRRVQHWCYIKLLQAGAI